jgi:LPS O-antigen subunit length determinant protein (WzzB/FepE family)
MSFFKDKLTKNNLKQKLEATKNDIKAVSSTLVNKLNQATDIPIKQKLEDSKTDLSTSLTKKLNQFTESPTQKQRYIISYFLLVFTQN